MTKNILDKFRGCLYGGTVRNALGYPIEFRTAEQRVFLVRAVLWIMIWVRL